MTYKTIRISYESKETSCADVAKYFEIPDEKDGGTKERDQGITTDQSQAIEITPDKDIVGKHLLAKFPDCHGYFITDTLVDFLVPEDFDVSKLGGVIVRSDGSDPLHEWLGHERTPMVVDKSGTLEEPVKVRTVAEKEAEPVMKEDLSGSK